MVDHRDITVFIDPFSHHFYNNELFNPENPHNIDNALWPCIRLAELLRSNGIAVYTADFLVKRQKVSKINVYFSFGVIRNYKALARRDDVVLSGLFTFEAPIVQPSLYRELAQASSYFRRIYCFTGGENLARFGCRDVQMRKFCIPYPYDQVFDELWAKQDRKFLVLLNWNRLVRMRYRELYTERRRALEFFSRYGEIDLYGIGWDREPDLVGETRIPATVTRIHKFIRQHIGFLRSYSNEKFIPQVYKGIAKSKYETQSDYTFAICYENMELPGWVNENIFDCFMVGTVPIYLGAPDITEYVPAECFIDKRQFPTYADLRAFLKSLSEKDIRAYRDNARDYVTSGKFMPFRTESFAQIIVQAIEEDARVQLTTNRA